MKRSSIEHFKVPYDKLNLTVEFCMYFVSNNYSGVSLNNVYQLFCEFIAHMKNNNTSDSLTINATVPNCEERNEFGAFVLYCVTRLVEENCFDYDTETITDENTGVITKRITGIRILSKGYYIGNNALEEREKVARQEKTFDEMFAQIVHRE